MDFRPIKSRKIYEEIVEQIKHLMGEGNLKPGDKLLSERELADKLQVSRTSVREALRALEMMGFVTIKPGEGTFVKETCTDSIIHPLAIFISIEKGSFLEIYEVRKILETASARLAAQRCSILELERMEQILKDMEKAFEETDSEKGETSDAEFHFAIAEATQNTWLQRLMHTISDTVHRSISAAREQIFLTPRNAPKILEQHRKIFEAIRKRDPVTAEQAMLEHLTFAEAEYLKHVPMKTPDI